MSAPNKLGGHRLRWITTSVGLLIFVAFSLWSIRLVLEVSSQRDEVAQNVSRIIAAERVLSAKELPPQAALEDLAGSTVAAAAELFPGLQSARDAGDLDLLQKRTQSMVRVLRSDTGRISRELGGKWDALNILVAVSLVSGLAMFVLLLVAMRQRAQAQSLTEDVRGAMDQLSVALERVEKSDQQKTRLLADVSHELRTPMVGLLGGIELLRRGELDEEQRTQIRNLHDSATGLRVILDDLIDLARIDAGSISIAPRDFSPRRLLEGALALSAGASVEAPASLEIGDDFPRALVGDPDRLRQIVGNLLSNAIKYAPGAAVALRADYREGELQLCVDDGGPGIPHEAREHACEPFVRLPAAAPRVAGTRPQPQGTGLGLAVCRGLATSMGGTLSLHESPAGGLRVRVTIPSPLSVHAPPSSMPDAGFSPPLRVLLVEDNELNRAVILRMLQCDDLELFEAANGLEALEICAREAPELVFMDCQMPLLDGLEATRKLRARRFDAPILALTATVGASERRLCIEAGMNAVLAKPVTGDELHANAQRWGRVSRQLQRQPVPPQQDA